MSDHRVEQIKRVSGIERADGETLSEYVTRVGEQYDVEAETIESVSGSIEKQFHPQASWSSEDQAAFDHFVDEIQQSDEETEKPTTGQIDGSTGDRERELTGGNVTEETRDDPAPSPDTSDERTETDLTSEQSSRSPLMPKARRLAGKSGETTIDARGLFGFVRQTLFRFPRSRPSKVIPDVRTAWQTKSWPEIGYATGIILIGALVFVRFLGHDVLIRWDESIYANVAQYMVVTGDWVTPHLYIHPQKSQIQYQPFLEKPPLVYWLQAVSISLFGMTRFAARFPIALLACLSGVLVYRFGRHMYDRTTGLVAVTVLFSTPAIVTGSHGGRTGSTDIPLLFFGSLFVYLTWVAVTEDRRDLLPLVGISAALAVLTKGFHAGVFVIAVAPIVLYHVRTILSPEAVSMVGITAFIAAPWPIIAWIQHGDEFIYQIFINQVLTRATGEGFVSASQTLFPFMRYPYFLNFPDLFGVWMFFLIPAALAVISGKPHGESWEKPLFLVWWAASTFGVFVATGNHSWYIIPMFVPCSILIGKVVSDSSRYLPPAIVSVAGGFTLLIVTAGITDRTLVLGLGFAVILSGQKVGSIARRQLSTSQTEFLRTTASLALVAFVVLSVISLQPFASSEPTYDGEEKLGIAANEHIPEGETIGLHTKTPKVWKFTFHANRDYQEVSTADLEGDPPVRYALVTNESAQNLSRNFTVLEGAEDMQLIQLSKEERRVVRRSS